MAGRLYGKRIAIIATDGVEEVELTQPREAVTSEGGQVDVVSLEEGELQAMNHDLEPAARIAVDRSAAQASPSDYDALILPGGTVNADRLRMDPDVRSFVQEVFSAGKPVGVTSRPVDADRRRRGRGPDAHVLPELAPRLAQRRGRGRRRGGRHR
jgi:protease I